MKLLKYFFSIAFLLAALAGCKKETYDDVSFIASGSTPEKLSALFDITQDNTGMVTITPNGQGGISYDVYFGDATATFTNVKAGGSVQHVYAEGVYNVRIVSHGITGKVSETTQELTVSFKAPENLEVTADIDAVNKFKVNVTAKATYETLFKVYFGDVTNEVPVSFLEGNPVSHVYAATGTYTVRVVALSGGAATTEFTKQITIVDPLLLPIDFESPTLNYAFNNFDGGAVSVVSNPNSGGINTSGKVAKMVKNAGQPWGGSWIGLGEPIDFSVNKIFRMKVFSPRVGAKVLLKVENATNGGISYEKEVSTTVANAWEDLVFDYSGVNTSNSYQHIVLIFDNGTQGDGSANFTFLFDDIRLVYSIPPTPLTLPVTFDLSGVNYAVTDFGGAQTTDGVDPTNNSNKVKITTKPTGAQSWAGTTIGTFTSAIPLSATATKMTIRVYSPAAGIHVRLKLEDKNDNTKSVETEANTTVANAWETLTFNFSNQATGTAAVNFTYTYNMASVFFDFGNDGNGKVFYWDDVTFLPTNVSPTDVVLPLDFESSVIPYTFTNFDGGNVSIISNPNSGGINSSAKVAKMVKSAGQPWGGSWIALSNPIDFSVKKTIHMKVFSPRVGAGVLLKVENMTDGSINKEVTATTTVANAWEDLTFDFSSIDVSKSYQKVVLIFDLGTMGDGSANFTFLLDDITLN
ncbi:hypothetical protein LK994_09275 [Ferruginibacter lapsinanis]|uniref:hypothetical protein n=1 Tax=Ferruginibacter lapsinanis TaxID=563172 RepID=UPI001E4D94C0|nr:hypothetical protein [Ferruginibacter lapsinanis]UEG48826.1 hypothetical protein LK994_09275 [Ferruginibacter lapsinanis]